MGRSPCPPAPNSPAGDVEIAQHVGLEPDLVDPVFDRITEADQPDQPAPVDDGEVAASQPGHLHHDALDAVPRGTHRHVALHHIADLPVEQLPTVAIQIQNDVPLGDDAGDLAVGAGDDERSDAGWPGKEAHCRDEGRPRLDRLYRPTLVGDESFDGHDRAPCQVGARATVIVRCLVFIRTLQSHLDATIAITHMVTHSQYLRSSNIVGILTVMNHEQPRAEDVEQVDAVMLAARVLVAITARSMAVMEEQLSLPQWRVLVMVERDGPLNLGAVARGLGVHPSNATRACDRLVAAGLLHRGEDADDRRNLVLTLTAGGSQLVQTVIDHRRTDIQDALGRMPDQQRRELVPLLLAFAQAADESPGSGVSALDWATHAG